VKLGLQWRWFLGLCILLILLLVVVTVCLNLTLPSHLERNLQADLERNAVMARAVFATELARDRTGIDRLARELSDETRLWITVMDANGKILGESHPPPGQPGLIENQLQRPEVQDAMRHEIGASRRHSDTINADMLYVAVAVRNGGALLGIVRVASPVQPVAATVSRVRRTVGSASLVVGLAAVPFLFWMTRRVTRPIQQMNEAAGRIARGEFPNTIRAEARGELGVLAATFNEMSSQLQTRLRELGEEKAELAAVLASMTEGVLVVDAGEKIRMMNNAFGRQFQLGKEAIGHTVLETMRSVPLQQLISATSQDGGFRGHEIQFLNPSERIFDVSAACLRGRDGAHQGTVVVFHDITRIKQLENVRKEFVANVSHELRTPLAIIKGYVETLLDGEPVAPPDAEQFLRTIQRHSRRLEALIEDLLTISALESQQVRLDVGPASLRSIASAVSEELSAQAKAKSIGVAIEIAEDAPQVRADAQRLHQVLFNLLDNAVKYTQAGGQVRIFAKDGAEEIEVCVADNGSGIAPEHLPRIFERFYRADKARSRELGGTGLGLSIVKHIVQAHGGRVWAESELGQGSTIHFTLRRA